ncbi:helix-turn-helix domain-containing protein [Nevskia sp.]|uniref:AraC-like ligand-binding domain-containing protein n=1 Tax=Nevskia sp. TaxID=1929292 RepID=UPI0025D91800|nr:helix-turn-helix domain-containing protein [Nevskia sp.]
MTTLPSPLVHGWQDPDVWSTGTVAPSKQFECWRAFVVDAHMRWDIRPVRCDCFPAYLRQGRFEGYRLTHLTAHRGGIVGRRGPHEIALDDEAFFNLIYIAEGSISLTIGGQDIALMPGQFTLWDTTRPMRFVTGENLRQITFAVPQLALRRVLPRVDAYIGRPIDSAADVSRLFVNHLLSLDETFGELPQAAAGHVLRATLELLAATLRAKDSTERHDGSHLLLHQAMNYVEQHLGEPALDTRAIARAYDISERHLHRLFERAETTPAAWIRHQRLERCRNDLHGSPRTSITEIAYRWGFRDSGTFSKIFRKAFGVTPRQERAGLVDRPDLKE